MVVFMDIAAQGNGGTGRISSDYSCEDTKDVVASVVENLPFSIPRSRIFYYHDFSCTKIAFGFYGDVFKVEHRRTKQVMVLKMSRPGRESEDCTIMEEIKLMNRLSHQNVIRFLGICLEESRVHLLCEYINGGNLEELLMNHSVPLEWSARLFLAKDIANGMEYLHNEGVIHRDLTSKNCLVKARNGWRYAIVADLGLATEMNAQSIVGSPYNMAPELLRGEAYDEKADVFSYGIILCEIIGRVQADPDELPRTEEFGLDVEKFRHMIGDCPHEFLLAALWCCQMEPSTRPTFGETVRHLEFLLVGSQRRPELDDVTTEETVPETTPSAPRTDKPQINDVHENNNTGATATPAIVISTETSPRGSGTTEKRRQSWYAGRHKLFNTATEDLLRNTPGKLKNFFHRVLRVHTHFDPTKHKKQKDSGKGRSASELRRFSLLDSVENSHKLTPGSDPLSASASLSYPNSPVTNTDRIPHRSLSDLRLSSEFGSEGDSIDGRSATRKYRSSSALSRSFNSSRQPPKSPNMLEATTSCPNSRHASESDTPVSLLLNQSRKARCKSMPTFDESKPDRLARRAGSHRLCEVNSDHATGDDGTNTTAKLKHKKSPFKIFRRKSTSKHKDADVDKS